MTIVLIILGVLFIATLVYKPEIIAVFFFTITIADINFEVSGLPLNMRAMVGLALFARSLVPDKEMIKHSFFSNVNVRLIVFFIFYVFVVTEVYELVTPEFLKLYALTFISVYTGYHYFFKTGNMRYLKISLAIAGVICFSDLVYTYAVYGAFPVQRIYQMLLGIPPPIAANGEYEEVINHNFYGLICGMSFVFILNDFINKKHPNKLILLLLPVMFLGILMSTSRSSLLGMIGISFFLISRELKHRERAKKAYMLITLALSALFISLFLFTSLESYFKLSSEFTDKITGRLIDEPIAVFEKHMGMNYNAQALDALEWRGEASTNAFDAFKDDLTFTEQIFGIGFWGFVTRNLGHNDLPPHNGVLLILIDNGIVGLILYSILIFSIFRKSIKVNPDISPALSVLIFVIFYCIGQNGELTSSITFLCIINLVAENEYLASKPKDEGDGETQSVTAGLDENE
ncbi:MAG: O-antigen ligase family protein [Bacteroidetes bacterium]|nr:O-antigen ligase family protein [Bacteroidota bacterium]